MKYKIGLIKTLTYRALKICSSRALLKQQCELIEETIVKNGYPTNLVRRKIQNTINQYQKINESTKKEEKHKTKLFMPLIYHGNETIIMSNKIKNTIENPKCFGYF